MNSRCHQSLLLGGDLEGFQQTLKDTEGVLAQSEQIHVYLSARAGISKKKIKCDASA